MNSSMETISGRARPEQILQTTLMGIASKAKRDKQYRFRDLYRQLNYNALRETWGHLNKSSAPGVDKVTAKEFAVKLDENINQIVDDLKGKRYHTKLVKRVYIDKDNGKKRPLGIPATSDKLLQWPEFLKPSMNRIFLIAAMVIDRTKVFILQFELCQRNYNTANMVT